MSSVGYKTTKPAETLAEALLATGLFATAKPVENGCAVRVETKATTTGKIPVPITTTTIWLPDPDVNAGYLWSAPVDHELDATAGLDTVVHAVAATLLPEVV